MSVSATILILRATRTVRREQRRRRRQLERELADYATPAQRLDLEAVLDRYSDGATHELRGILAAQDLVALTLHSETSRGMSSRPR